MNRVRALKKLTAAADAVRAFGATALYLFGSTAKNKARPGSDVDVFIEYDKKRGFSLMDLAGIQLLLEEELNVPVDVTTRSGLHPLLREEIEKTAIRIF